MAQVKSSARPFNWAKLEASFRILWDVVNANEPLEGEGIRIVETANGKLISVAGQSQGSAAPGGSGGAGGPSEGSWMTVTIVDPASCAQSEIQVWTRPVPP